LGGAYSQSGRSWRREKYFSLPGIESREIQLVFINYDISYKQYFEGKVTCWEEEKVRRLKVTFLSVLHWKAGEQLQE
jgi:hypothetical protein